MVSNVNIKAFYSSIKDVSSLSYSIFTHFIILTFSIVFVSFLRIEKYIKYEILRCSFIDKKNVMSGDLILNPIAM